MKTLTEATLCADELGRPLGICYSRNFFVKYG